MSGPAFVRTRAPDFSLTVDGFARTLWTLRRSPAAPRAAAPYGPSAIPVPSLRPSLSVRRCVMLPRIRPALAGFSLLIALAACADREPLIPGPQPEEPVRPARLECTVTVASGAMSTPHRAAMSAASAKAGRFRLRGSEARSSSSSSSAPSSRLRMRRNARSARSVRDCARTPRWPRSSTSSGPTCRS